MEPEFKFIAGRYLTLPPYGEFDGVALTFQLGRSPIPLSPSTGNQVPGGDLSRFTLAPGSEFVIMESTGGRWRIDKRTSAVHYAMHMKSHRNFRWLTYVEGEITCLPLAGYPVLTGEFSGCWLAIFQVISTGTMLVAHIGTGGSSNDPRTLAVKAAWRAAVDNNLIRPIRAIHPPVVATASMQGYRPAVYGLVTSSQEMYTMVWQKPYDVASPGKGITIKIESVERATTVTAPVFNP
jgi:hypothetical protein